MRLTTVNISLTFSFLFTMILSGCSTTNSSQPNNSVYKAYFKNITGVESITKTVIINGQKETKTITTDNLDKEVKVFNQLDSTLQKQIAQYNIDTTSYELSSIKRITFKATSPKLKISQAQYFLKDNTVIEMNFTATTDENIYSENQHYVYWPGQAYAQYSNQSIKGFGETEYSLYALFNNGNRYFTGLLSTDDNQVPVRLQQIDKEWFIINGSEHIKTNVATHGDTTILTMPGFGSVFTFTENYNALIGSWNYPEKGADYTMNFEAYLAPPVHYGLSHDSQFKGGHFKVLFADDETAALGIIENVGNVVLATIVTETGDYRYMQGTLNEKGGNFSAFDGAHVYSFQFMSEPNGNLKGSFEAGPTYETTWEAMPDSEFTLTDPNAMTKALGSLKDMDVSFKNIQGDVVQLNGPQYQGKVVVINLMGTWCPNCMDETQYFSALYNELNNPELAIVSLCFERYDNFEKALPKLKQYQQDFNVPYDILFAGRVKSGNVEKLFPFIDKMRSYPTSLFIDKTGNVVKVHTGFYGPGTGDLFKEYDTETRALLDELLLQ